MFIDTHCHVLSEYYNDIESVLKTASNKGVSSIISNAYDLNSCKEVLELAKKFSHYYCALGIHPESVSEADDEYLDFIEKNISNSKVVAIGEIGLDYFYTKDNKEAQINLFKNQLKIAEKNHLPVIVHSRDAIQDTYDILKNYNVKGIIHSFSGSYEMAEKFIKLGYLLGINGIVTFKNCNLKEVIQKVGLDNIVLETDSPYLTPEPYRGKQNNPTHIIDIANYLAKYFDKSLIEIEKITNNNFKRIFDILN